MRQKYLDCTVGYLMVYMKLDFIQVMSENYALIVL